MDDTVIKTQAGDLTRAYQTDSVVTGTSIANPADRALAPTGDGIVDMAPTHGLYSSNSLMLFPFGTGSATNTFLLSVFGWDLVHPKIAQNAKQWTAALLASFTCTLSTLTGLPGGEIDDTHFWCDTIVLAIGNANVSVEVVSPTANVKAHILIDTKGCRHVGLLTARDNSASSANVAWRRM